jgi:hypothetical protein
MAIFGTGVPKILTSASVEISLPCSKYLKNGPRFDNVIHENVVSGIRVFLHKGYRWEIELLIHLYKYADPAATFTALNTALYDEVTFWRHSDWDPICNSVGATVPFWLEKITPFYLETVTYKDALKLEFVSLGYVDLNVGAGTGEHIVDDETGEHIVDDETGEPIITD